jgi:type I restriction enzyme S subunit
LLISIRGTVGRLAEVPESLDGANITQDTARLAIDRTHDRHYVRRVLESDFAQSQIRRRVTGLAVKGLNLGALRKIQVPIPTNKNDERLLVEESAVIDAAITAAKRSRQAAMDILSGLLAEIFGGS